MRGQLNRLAYYLKKVFKFHRLVRRFTDCRQDPKIPTHSVVLTLFFGAVLRVPSSGTAKPPAAAGRAAAVTSRAVIRTRAVVWRGLTGSRPLSGFCAAV